MIKRIKIFDVFLNDMDYDIMLELTKDCIIQKKKKIIGYCTAHTLNQSYDNIELTCHLNTLDYLHSDGIGSFLASKIIYGKDGLKKRITGSDYYPLLAEAGIKNDWSFYFFGDIDKVLNTIIKNHPQLNVKGQQQGYSFSDKDVISDINQKNVDILIVGLGTPLQEEWVFRNQSEINVNIIYIVGDGIKIFSGTRIRGPIILRRMGFEWSVRLITNPFKLWRRYLIGIPQFMLRVIYHKIMTGIQ
jgi:N-acetylglucosaminyldiphosphoundecaprenol N-acetyl-beta-D-mannosaminyltransferase